MVGVLNDCVRARFLLDTGATHSLMPLEILEKLTPKPRLTALPAQRSQITGFNGEKSQVVGECELTVAVPGKHFTVKFLVVDAPCSCILGIDFIDGQDVQFDRDMNYVCTTDCTTSAGGGL
jgi:hypothetical protein